MSDVAIGFAGLAGVLVALLLRLPVSVALGGVSLICISLIIGLDSAVHILSIVPYEFSAHWSLSSIPMFLLMGYVAYHAGMTEGLFRLAQLWLSAIRGGLAHASIVGAAMFSAVTGSSLACAAAMGRVAVPEMMRYRYDVGLAAGVVAAAGTLGSLIPPSVLFLIYGNLAEVPISKLFIAGVLPGILTAAMYMAVVAIRTARNPQMVPEVSAAPMRERLLAVRESWPMVALVLGVFGGLFAGVMTATEAGALGAFLATAIAVARRTLALKAFKSAVLDTLHSTASIFAIAVGAALMTRMLALTGVPDYLAELAVLVKDQPYLLVLGVSVIYLLLGCFLDPIGILLLTLPILLPMFEAAEIDLIWMGVILVKYVEIGLITPPVGLNVFVIKGVLGRDVELGQIFRGVAWFILADIVTVGLLIVFPEISLYLTRFVN